MLRAGLTGGIGCGKSTVAALMRDLGCHVVDADKISRQLVEPGKPAYDDIVREFGREILAADLTLDRARLAAVVFADPARLTRLNAIVHPRVLEEEDRELREIERANPHGVGIVEAALLVESGFYRRLDRLIVACCTAEQQLARLTDPAFGRKMTREDAQRRIAAQISLEEKRRVADDVIDCSGTMDETRTQVATLVEQLKNLAAATPRTR